MLTLDSYLQTQNYSILSNNHNYQPIYYLSHPLYYYHPQLHYHILLVVCEYPINIFMQSLLYCKEQEDFILEFGSIVTIRLMILNLS